MIILFSTKIPGAGYTERKKALGEGMVNHVTSWMWQVVQRFANNEHESKELTMLEVCFINAFISSKRI